ncbi:MAG: DUF5675 family protein [Bacteroidota bacterium]
MGVSLRIQRGHDDGTQTLGTLFVQRSTGSGVTRALAAFPCLELGWNGNRNSVSSILPGTYRVRFRRSARFGRHLHVQSVDGGEVPGRKWILIHAGNRHDQIRGCILPGLGYGDAGGDGRLDVVQSRKAMARLMALVPAGGCPLYVHASAEHDEPGFDLRASSAPVNP